MLELDLRGRGLETVPPYVWDLTQLEVLNLSENALTSVSPRVGRLRVCVAAALRPPNGTAGVTATGFCNSGRVA